ncbi:MAG TPA: ACT domain-containing protein [Egibacteraceae bacterium]|jgi:hypothetical protein|nr:ACT domain-containing protein [Egibacteraceae bacterium]
MEIVLRCLMADRPGALASLAGAVGKAGGDIQSVEVLEHDDGQVLDDLVVAIDPLDLRALVTRLQTMEGVELVHAGPSRGDPGDAVTRLAIVFEALLDGSMLPERALTTLVGGLLRASSAEVVATAQAPRSGRRTLVVPVDGGALVVRRDYPFTRAEQQRATTITRACARATAGKRSVDYWSGTSSG